MTSNAPTKLATSWRTLVPVAVLSAAVGFLGGRIGQSPDDQPGAGSRPGAGMIYLPIGQ